MSELTRRQLLQRLVGSVTSVVVVARAALAGEEDAALPTPEAPADRADRLADELPPEGVECSSFLNRAFRNGGGFANGGFRNGGFVNGGFRNGGFRNGGFVNGGFRNGGFVNGGFRNW